MNFWTILITIFIGDIFLERYSGTNLFGWGANEINGIPQVYGDRVLSFFKDEPMRAVIIRDFTEPILLSEEDIANRLNQK